MPCEVEVRCCCQPQKLLGWLPVPSPRVTNGQWVTFLVRPVVGPVSQWWAAERLIVTPGERLALQVHEWVPAGVDGRWPRLALKAEGVELDLLRRIAGFREAPS